MGVKGEHVICFLESLRAHKEAAKRLYDAVESDPQQVIDFIELLPHNWEETYDDDMVDLLKTLEKRAKAIASRLH